MISTVYLFSYEVPHLKTIDLAEKLAIKGYSVTILGFPFIEKIINKLEQFKERPHQIIEGEISIICKKIGVSLVKVPSWNDNDIIASLPKNRNDTIYITCISKIIPKEIIAGRIILNAHPGLLPENRGVDAFKWGIINLIPFGVTVHAVNEYIDAGTILARVIVPIKIVDSLVDVAFRSYELENLMLANFDMYINNLDLRHEVDIYASSLSKVRVPEQLSKNIESIFLGNRHKLTQLGKLKESKTILNYDYQLFKEREILMVKNL